MDEDAVVTRLARVWRAGATDDPHAQLAGWRKRETDREYRLSLRTPASQRPMTGRTMARWSGQIGGPGPG